MLCVCVSEVEVVFPFCSFLYLSMAGMLYTIIPCSEIHDRKLTVTYALRVSPHQFESKCNQAKELGTTPVFSGSLSSPFSSGQNMGGPGVMKSNVAKVRVSE